MHESLGRDGLDSLAVLELEAGLDDRGKRDGVARTACTLVTLLASEVVAIIIGPVNALGQLTDGDLLRSLVLLHKGLSLIQSFLEVSRFLIKLLGSS